MVIVKLAGGLGNQLFQYAAGRSLSHRENSILKLDCSYLESDPKRSYRLGFFHVHSEIASSEEIKGVRQAGFGKYYLSVKQTEMYDRFKPYYRRRTISERNFHYDKYFGLIKSPAYLIGYWQSEKYFNSIEEVLIDDLKLCVTLSNEDKVILEHIRATNAVSIHVRRGDFVSDSKINAVHGICSEDYYVRALRIIYDNINAPHFFVFSDDVSWVRSNLDLGSSVTYVDHNGPDMDYADFKLMQACSHHIIANSSFSWWAAWLANNSNKIVIAPKKWFRSSDRNTQDLLPDNWHKT